METSISLKSWKNLISCNAYTLQVSNFFTLAKVENKDFEMDSPAFKFENATWCFRCCSEKKSKNKFSVDIVRLKTELPVHIVHYKIALFDARGTIYSHDSHIWEIDESEERQKLQSYMYDHHSHDGPDTFTLIIHLYKFDVTEVDEKQATWTKDSLHGMIAEMKNCKISLKSTKKTFSSDIYSLQSLKFVEFGQNDFDITSPTFEFANETCRFSFCSTGILLDIKFEALNPKKQLQNICLLFVLVNSNGEVMDKIFRVHRFPKIYRDVLFVWDPFCTVLVQVFAVEELEASASALPIMKSKDFKSLSQDLKKIFFNEEDLTIKVQGTEFRVHQEILKVRSQVFKAMLSHNMTEKNRGIIMVQDIDAQVMELLLIYIYSGNVGSLNEHNAIGLYYAADKYDVTSLKKECIELLKKTSTPSVICDVIQLALNYNDPSLLKCGTELFLNHVGDILPTVDMMSFVMGNPALAVKLLFKYIKAKLFRFLKIVFFVDKIFKS